MSKFLCSTLLCLILSVSQKAYSNGNLLPGYYIEKSGDSVRCQIDYQDWGRNPEAVNVTVNNVQKTLKPEDIRGFGVTGYCDYISAAISYHLGSISGNDIPQQYLNKTATKTAFLKLLVPGPYSLYEFVSPERAYYFISENGGQPLELVYQVKQADMLISEDAEYRSQLAQYLTKENLWEQQSADIGRLGYSRSGFMKMVIRLNEAHTGQKTQPVTRKTLRATSIQLDISAGPVLHIFPGISAPLPTDYLHPAISAEGGLSCRIIFPGHFGAWSFGFGLGYTSFSSDGAKSGSVKTIRSSNEYDIATFSEHARISNSLLLINAYFMYMLPASGKLRWYGKLGVNVGFVRSPDGNVYSDYTSSDMLYYSTYQPVYDGGGSGTNQEVVGLGSTGVSGQVAVGAQVGRSRLEIAYDSPMELAANGQASFKVSGLGLNYIFTVIR